MKILFALEKLSMGTKVKRLRPKEAYQMIVLPKVLSKTSPAYLSAKDKSRFKELVLNGEKVEDYVYTEMQKALQMKLKGWKVVGIIGESEEGRLAFQKFCEDYNISQAWILDTVTNGMVIADKVQKGA